MKKPISITIEEKLIDYVDELCDINGFNRSQMISKIILDHYRRDMEDGQAESNINA